MNAVLRREEKYALKYSEALYFSSMFEKLLQKDSSSENGIYHVRSLYFDTINDKDFFDKINEQELRRKIRLRIYDLNEHTTKLELKQKQGVYQKKRSMSILYQDALDLIQGNYSVLLKYNHDFANELYGIMSTECYQPKTIIEYQRKAFMAKENNIRLTFDSDIRATESNFDLFSKNLLLNNILYVDNVIFEVKYNQFLLGYISEIISHIDRRTVTSSKYCLGRSIGYPLYL